MANPDRGFGPRRVRPGLPCGLLGVCGAIGFASRDFRAHRPGPYAQHD